MSKSVKTREPPCTERYARWCERSAGHGPPPTQSVLSMSEELIGQDNDGGRVTLTLNYYDSAEKNDETEPMEILHQRYKGKETMKHENAIH